MRLHYSLAQPRLFNLTRVTARLPCLLSSTMPSSDYTSAVGGGLKLKGSGGINKKKKKKKSKPTEDKPSSTNNDADAPTTDLQKALANEDDVDKVEVSEEVKEYGKTEAQRRHEERRKKRVSSEFTYKRIRRRMGMGMLIEIIVARRTSPARRSQNA